MPRNDSVQRSYKSLHIHVHKILLLSPCLLNGTTSQRAQCNTGVLTCKLIPEFPFSSSTQSHQTSTVQFVLLQSGYRIPPKVTPRHMRFSFWRSISWNKPGRVLQHQVYSGHEEPLWSFLRSTIVRPLSGFTALETYISQRKPTKSSYFCTDDCVGAGRVHSPSCHPLLHKGQQCNFPGKTLVEARALSVGWHCQVHCSIPREQLGESYHLFKTRFGFVVLLVLPVHKLMVSSLLKSM